MKLYGRVLLSFLAFLLSCEYGIAQAKQFYVPQFAIGSFYSNRVFFMYKVPERTVVSYVEFPATNYFAEADKELAAETNLTEFIHRQWLRWDTNDTLIKDDKGVLLGEADAKKKIGEVVRTNQALLKLPARGSE